MVSRCVRPVSGLPMPTTPGTGSYGPAFLYGSVRAMTCHEAMAAVLWIRSYAGDVWGRTSSQHPCNQQACCP